MRLLCLILSVLSFNALANEILPFACRPLSLKGESLEVAADKPTVLMVHNLSQTDLWLTHVLADPNASTAWSTRLQPDNWSALALEKERFTVSCIESRPGHEQQVDCSDVLAVCEWPLPSLPDTVSKTAFWAAEDMSLSALTARLGRNGFKLPVEKSS